jgi:hypothetical protein
LPNPDDPDPVGLYFLHFEDVPRKRKGITFVWDFFCMVEDEAS